MDEAEIIATEEETEMILDEDNSTRIAKEEIEDKNKKINIDNKKIESDILNIIQNIKKYNNLDNSMLYEKLKILKMTQNRGYIVEKIPNKCKKIKDKYLSGDLIIDLSEINDIYKHCFNPKLKEIRWDGNKWIY